MISEDHVTLKTDAEEGINYIWQYIQVEKYYLKLL